MSRIIDFEREFFKVAKGLETKSVVKKVFVARIRQMSEDWIEDKLRRNILGLEDED